MSTGSKIHTHYDNLKVARDAPDSVIRAAYKALSQQYHPDKHGGDSAASNIMRLINEAYAELSDPAKRRAHDAWIAAQEAPSGPSHGRPSAAPARPSERPTPSRQAETTIRKDSKWWNYGSGLLILIVIIAAVNSGKSGSPSPSKPPVAGELPDRPSVQNRAPDSAGVKPPNTASRKADPPSTSEGAFADLLPRGRVVAPELNVRAGPSTKQDVVARLRFLDTVSIEGPASNGRIPISHKAGFGYVNSSYIQVGPDGETLVSLCTDNQPLPTSGTLLKRPDMPGDHELRITSSDSGDALVKLKDHTGRTVLAGYVRRGESHTFRGIPAGSYSAWFATGSAFSVRCGRFLQDMSVTYDRAPQDYKTTRSGNLVYSTIIEYSLQRQRGGNFSPSGGDLDMFVAD